MILVTIEKRNATAADLSTFEREDCRAVIDQLVNRGRKWGVATQIIESGTPADSNASVAAIEFALATDDGLTFLRLWQYGEFDAIRKEWPDAPISVFIGADPSLEVKSK